ncbi:MAG: hypothetical protein ABI305_07480, partial [Tepidiformaceae bacterium]
MKHVVDFVVGFGSFWYDFIVGDSMTLAIGTVIAVAGCWALIQILGTTGIEVVLPAIVLVTLV